jgi:hypothetical protein
MKVPNTKRKFGESGDYVFAKINGNVWSPVVVGWELVV